MKIAFDDIEDSDDECEEKEQNDCFYGNEEDDADSGLSNFKFLDKRDEDFEETDDEEADEENYFSNTKRVKKRDYSDDEE